MTIQAEVDVTATICGHLDRIAGLLDKAAMARDALLNAVIPLDVPPQFGTVTSGGVLVIASPELLGPRDGWFWDIHRISIAGLASSTEVANIYKGFTGSSVDAVNNLYLTTIAGPRGSSVFNRGGCLLRPKQNLSAGGAGLTASEVVWMTIEGVEIQADYLGAYLL